MAIVSNGNGEPARKLLGDLITPAIMACPSSEHLALMGE